MCPAVSRVAIPADITASQPLQSKVTVNPAIRVSQPVTTTSISQHATVTANVVSPQTLVVLNSANRVRVVTPSISQAQLRQISNTANLSNQQLAKFTVVDAQVIEALVPKTRGKVKGPIAPSDDIKADTVFEDAKNSAQKIKLPKHAIAEQQVNNRWQYKINFKKNLEEIESDIWELELELKELPLPDNISKLDSQPELVLKHKTHVGLSDGSPMVKEHVFQAVHEGQQKWRLVISGIAVRDQIVRALQQDNLDTVLLMRHAISFAVPAKNLTKGKKKQPIYRQTSRKVDVPVEPVPFVMSTNMHGYLYEEITRVSDTNPGYQRFMHGGHIYYQDEAQPELIHYFCDEYQLTRKPEAPFAPNMVVRFYSEDSSLENMRATVEYSAAPVVDIDRLEALRTALQTGNIAPIRLRDRQKETISLLPFIVDNPEQIGFELALPRSSSSSQLREKRQGIVRDLSSPFIDAIDLGFKEYQAVYDALFGASSVLLKGSIMIHLAQDPDVVIDFNARFNAMHGELFSYQETLDQTKGCVHVDLTNAIESEVKINKLPVDILVASGETYPAEIRNIRVAEQAQSLPLTLKPGETARFECYLQDNQSLTETDKPDALFELDDILVNANSEAIYNLILDPSVTAEYQRNIQIKSFEAMFAPNTDVQALVLDFPGESDVLLSSGKLEATAKVLVPLKDVVLRNTQDPEVHYKLTIIRTDGSQEKVDRTSSSSILIPEV